MVKIQQSKNTPLKSRTWKAPTTANMMFTIEKPYGTNRTSLRGITLDDFFALLHDGPHRAAVETLRSELPTSRGLTSEHPEIWRVGRIIPSCFVRNQQGKRSARIFNGVVLLDIQDVYSPEEVARLKQAASSLPTTLAAFVGSSGMSLQVLVRYWSADGVLSREWSEVEALHAAAYEQACRLYAAVLERTIKEPAKVSMFNSFRMTIDPNPYWAPGAVPLKVVAGGPARPTPVEPSQVPPTDSRHYRYYSQRFDKAYSEVLQRFRQEGRDASIEADAFMQAVTQRCFELQLPLAETRMRIVRGEPEERAREWTYYVNDYYARHASTDADDADDPVGARAMVRMISSSYELFRNPIDGATYFRPRTTTGRWQLLDKSAQASIEFEVLEAGLVKSVRLVRTYLQSGHIPMRNPLSEFLGSVRGQWDGQDRITQLARCVATGNPLWERAFYIWFLAMVQQWLGLHPEHGNAVAPLLCGAQGTGKSTFCRALLPDMLRWGYLDHIDLTRTTQLMRFMSQMLLINIDEFDQYRGNAQRGPLKNLFQQADIRTTRPWGQHLEVRPRLASFIATCNPTEVLFDETGTRRFICVRVDAPIVLPAYIDYEQLYAQAVDQIYDRRNSLGSYADDDPTGRCYFTAEEQDDIERNNSHFRIYSYAIERFRDAFEPQADQRRRGADTVELSFAGIIDYIDRHSQNRLSREERQQLRAHITRLVNEGQLARRRSNKGVVYHLARRPLPVI